MNQRQVVNVKIKKLHPAATIPKYAKPGDSGVDLVAVENVIVKPGETSVIPTGLAFSIPDGWELQIRPRSGISAKTKLRVSNAPGSVDSSYRGEVKVLIDNIFPPIYEKDGTIAMTDVVVSMDGKNDDVTFAKTHCFPSGTHYIPKGTRIAQAVFAPVGLAEFEVVDELDETERGAGAFGSSGIK